MSQLFYDIHIQEEYNHDATLPGGYALFQNKLPHLQQIKDYLPKTWEDCHIEQTFDGILKDKVTSCPMRIFENKNGQVIARITINFAPGFRLSEKRRQACWEQLDAQMSDGFGECVDGQRIPNTPDGWTLYL